MQRRMQETAPQCIVLTPYASLLTVSVGLEDAYEGALKGRWDPRSGMFEQISLHLRLPRAKLSYSMVLPPNPLFGQAACRDL